MLNMNHGFPIKALGNDGYLSVFRLKQVVFGSAANTTYLRNQAFDCTVIPECFCRESMLNMNHGFPIKALGNDSNVSVFRLK